MYKIQKNLPFREIKPLNFPIVVQLQTISSCNARCIMCPYKNIHNTVSHGIMEKKLFCKIVDECAQNNVIEFKPFLMNEPLLDKRFASLISYARQKLPKAKIGFSTNGQHLSNDIASVLIENSIDEVWVNFSGNSKETYERVMVGLDYNIVKDNLINFAYIAEKKEAKTNICISMVEIQDNLTEIEDSINFWKQYNVKVHPIPYNNRGGNSDEIEIKVLYKNVINKRVCDKPTNKICILYNGDVILCPSDWRRNFIIGNVNTQSIEEIWFGDHRKYYIEKILECKYEDISLCENCDFPLIYE